VKELRRFPRRKATDFLQSAGKRASCTDVALLGTESAANDCPRTVTGATDEYTDGVGFDVPIAKPTSATATETTRQ
jgi:hypothetical protein